MFLTRVQHQSDETLIALKIRECEEQGMTYEQVIETVEAYIESQHT